MDMQIICIDDGSTDDSASIIADLAQIDDRILLLRQGNRSAGAARNRGMQHAIGKYLHFLDADDWLCPNLYQTVMNKMSETGVEVCAFQYYLYNNETRSVHRFPCFAGRRENVLSLEDSPAFLLYNSQVPWNKLYLRSWVEHEGITFDEIQCANDSAFYFRMLNRCPRILHTPFYGVFYRTNNNRSLMGEARISSYDCLYHALESAYTEYQDRPRFMRDMITDVFITHMLEVLDCASPAVQGKLSQKLCGWFQQIELPAEGSLPFPCAWQKRYLRLRTQVISPSPSNAREKLSLLVRKFRIWGLYGVMVKFICRVIPAKEPAGC